MKLKGKYCQKVHIKLQEEAQAICTSVHSYTGGTAFNIMLQVFGHNQSIGQTEIVTWW